jgi:hypothetical protein
MNPNDFEKRLQRQPLRKIPSEWRNQILKSATPVPHVSRFTLHSFLSTLLWPNPKAWAGLAAVWILIIALHVAGHESTPMMATISATSSSDTVITLKEQQKILVELMGNNDSNDTEKPRNFPAQPHTERRRATSMA